MTPDDEVFRVAASPSNVLYAARERDGLFRSLDAGETWETLGSPAEIIRTLIFDPNENVLAGTNDGIYRLAEDGQTWQQIGLEEHFVLDLATAGAEILAAATTEGLYRSTDAGATWALVDTLKTPTALVGLPNGEVYVGTAGISVFEGQSTGVYHLTEQGVLSFLGLKALSITTLAVDAQGHLWAGTEGGCTGFICLPPAGLYRSSDGGETWASTGLTSTAVAALTFDAQGRLIVGTSGLFTDTGPLPSRGLVRTADEGATWTPLGEGIPRAQTYALAPAPGGLLYAAADHSIYRSRDHGNAWAAIYTREPTIDAPWAPYYDLAAGPEGTLYLLAGNPPRLDGGIRFVAFMRGEVMRSEDQGETWSVVRSDTADAFSVGSLTVTPGGSLLVATSQSGLLRSEDRGDTWSTSSTGLPPDQPVLTLESVGGRLFAATWDTRPGMTLINFFISDDEGQSWTPIGSQSRGFGSERTLLVAPRPDTLYVGANRLMRFTEDAGTWTGIEVSAIQSPLLAMEVDANGVLYAATWDTLLRSTDGGESWTSIETGLDLDAIRQEVHALTVGPDGHLYAGLTQGGVFRSVGPVSTDVEEGPTLPEVFHLDRNYPNPFQDETRIPFTLTRLARVELVVYTMQGHEIATLLAQSLPAGSYDVVWDAAGQASGVYVYKLIADGAVKAGRMVLVK